MNGGLETEFPALTSALCRCGWPSSCFNKAQLNKEMGCRQDDWDPIPGRDFSLCCHSQKGFGATIPVPNWYQVFFPVGEVARSWNRSASFYYSVQECLELSLSSTMCPHRVVPQYVFFIFTCIYNERQIFLAKTLFSGTKRSFFQDNDFPLPSHQYKKDNIIYKYLIEYKYSGYENMSTNRPNNWSETSCIYEVSQLLILETAC